MKYPDGNTVHVGDLIWWNEGESLGYVHEIYDDGIDLGDVIYNEPTMSISNRHPFDPTSYGGILQVESQLEDEGVGKLEPEEKIRFNSAINKALEKASPSAKISRYSVHTICRNGRMISWKFVFSESEAIMIPWK